MCISTKCDRLYGEEEWEREWKRTTKKKEKKEEEKLFLCAVINHTCMYGSKHVEESSKWYNNST